MVNQDRNVFAACMVATGEADAVVTGLTRSTAVCLDDIGHAIDPLPDRIAFGLTLVLVEGDRQRGIRFCEEAVRRTVTSEALVNLARALVVTRNKEQAVRALRKAMELSPSDPRLGQEFAALGLRRPPPLPWFPREFFLNKWLGKLSWKLFKHTDPLAR